MCSNGGLTISVCCCGDDGGDDGNCSFVASDMNSVVLEVVAVMRVEDGGNWSNMGGIVGGCMISIFWLFRCLDVAVM